MYRIIAAKCANSFIIQKISNYLWPIQSGVGVPGGAEAAVYFVRRYVNTIGDDDIIVKLDFVNTFISLRKETVMETIAQKYIASVMQHISENQFFNL